MFTQIVNPADIGVSYAAGNLHFLMKPLQER